MYEITRGRVPTAMKVVLYGVEGIGKTTFASQFPNPVFIDTEGGTKTFDVARFPAPLSWQMLLEEVQSVIQNPTVCGTLVIDTMDWAEKLAYAHVCASKKWDSIESPSYGVGYRYAYEEMGRLLNLLSQVVERGVNVLMVAHAAMRKFEQPDEMGSYDRWELKLQTSSKCNTAAMVREYGDMVLFANYETFVVKNEEKKNKVSGGKRVMYTTHHPCWDAKNRFNLPEKLPFDFSQIAHCFHAIPPVVQERTAPTVQPIQQTPQVQENPTMDGSSSPQKMSQTSPSDDGIPPELQQLMVQNGVTEAQIRKVVAGRGYYPEQTPIGNYDPKFVSGVLVGAWPQVYQMIKESN